MELHSPPPTEAGPQGRARIPETSVGRSSGPGVGSGSELGQDNDGHQIHVEGAIGSNLGDYFLVSLSQGEGPGQVGSGHALDTQPAIVDGNHAPVHASACTDLERSAVVRCDLPLPEPLAASSDEVPPLLPARDVSETCEETMEDTGLQAAMILEGMTHQEAAAYAKLKLFCSNIMKKLTPLF